MKKINLIIFLFSFSTVLNLEVKRRMKINITSPPLIVVDNSNFPENVNFLQVSPKQNYNNTFESFYSNMDLKKFDDFSKNNDAKNNIQMEENEFSNYFNKINAEEYNNIINNIDLNQLKGNNLKKFDTKDNDMLLSNLPTLSYSNIYKNIFNNNTNFPKDMPIIELPTDPSKIDEELKNFYNKFNVDTLNQNMAENGVFKKVPNSLKSNNTNIKENFRFKSKNSEKINILHNNKQSI